MINVQVRVAIVFSGIILLACSCNNSTNKAKENYASQTIAKDSSIAPTDNNSSSPDLVANKVDTASPVTQNNNVDSMLSQMKNLTSLFGKSDSGILKSLGGGGNMDSMIKKVQSMMGGKNGSPGDAVSNLLLNFQLGQMSDDNPLKAVTKGMMEGQKNGTAGPAKTYTATYAPEQAEDYKVPVSGNGNTIMLQYTGGSIANNKKDGLWKNLYVSTNKTSKWNVYSEAYAESSSINMKVHATSLASINENYNINLNEQYKKYANQQRSDIGKYESDAQVQKIGNEKMFGYNCVHVKIVYTVKAMGQTSHEQTDEWYSVDVPGSPFLSPVIFENHSPGVVKKIMDAGCSGVLIKSITKSPGSSQVIQLSSIMQKDMPDSMFSVPANYQEDKNTVLYDVQ